MNKELCKNFKVENGMQLLVVVRGNGITENKVKLLDAVKFVKGIKDFKIGEFGELESLAEYISKEYIPEVCADEVVMLDKDMVRVFRVQANTVTYTRLQFQDFGGVSGDILVEGWTPPAIITRVFVGTIEHGIILNPKSLKVEEQYELPSDERLRKVEVRRIARKLTRVVEPNFEGLVKAIDQMMAKGGGFGK
jgi:hypothetical protein